MWSKILPDVWDMSLAPLRGLVISLWRHPRLAPWAAFLRRFAAFPRDIRLPHARRGFLTCNEAFPRDAAFSTLIEDRSQGFAAAHDRGLRHFQPGQSGTGAVNGTSTDNPDAPAHALRQLCAPQVWIIFRR
jgi:hypothetical protein